MKHKIERTNPSTKRFSTRTIAMVLSIVMLIGSIATGSMLSTFAAYLKDAAKADAVTQAAAEGGNIALNAIPSEDNADKAEETPDLSGLEENEIIRGMKDDLASVSAKADLARTGATTYYLIYNTSNNSDPSYLTGNTTMKTIGAYYWGDISVSTDQFYFGISTSTSYTDMVLTSSRDVTMDSNGILNQKGNQQWNPNYYYCYAHTTSSTTVYVRWDGENALYVTTTKPDGYDEGGSGSSESNSGEGYDTSTVTIDGTPNLTQVYYDFSNISGGANHYSVNNYLYDTDVSNDIILSFLPSNVASNWGIVKTNSGSWATITYGTKGENNKFDVGSGGTTASWSKYADFDAPSADVISGNSIMIYIKPQYDTGINNPIYLAKDDTSMKKAHRVSEKVGYLEVSTSDLNDYKYITAKSDWQGTACNTAIDSSSGGAYFVGGGAKTAATTATTNNISSIVQGTTALSVTTSSDKTTSAIGSNMFYQYYIDGTKVGTTYKASTTEKTTSLDVSSLNLTVGSHTLKTVLTDGGVYYVADTDTFTVSTPTYYDVTVKSNNARLGSGSASPASAYAGQTVTVNISENMGTIKTVTATDASSNAVAVSGTGTSRTFTMPASAVTVNLTFEDYVGTSNFYYNSYETNGEESSTRYGQQMTEGRINGQEFSYYHVEGRTGTDQLFTVSYGNPAETGTIFFRTPESWKDKHGWDSGVQAQFFSSDDVQLKDWAWMTFDKDYGNGDKVYKISVPYGARKVQFRTQKNDPSTSNWPYTAICDLNDAKNSNDCFYIKSYSTSGNQTDIGTCNIGNQAHVIADGFWENFWGTNKYTNNFDTKGFTDHGANHTGNHRYIKPTDLGADSGDYYIIVLYNNTEYTINGKTHTVDKDPEIIWMSKLPGTEDIDSSEVNVYGKDGPIVIDWNNKTASGATGTSGTAYGYSLIADTELYDSDGATKIGQDVDDDGASYEKAKVVVTSEDSANIVIKTTIANAYRSKYYLKGWCINGVTYACGTNAKGVNAEGAGSNGVYTMTYTIPAGTEDSANIEITPIYYLTSTYKSANNITTVTFFLEGYNTITEKWGDTPYIYPFYGNLNNVDNSFGVYPGQPMVFASGQYSVEVPVNKNVPIANTLGSTVVKGITINNGYADHVHRNLVYKWSDHDNDQEHKQTYDYDDFYKIYEECLKNGNEHPNSIIFRIQDEETVFNRAQYGGGKSGQFAAGTSNISISDIATSGNGWELLVNRYDNAVNIFGSHTGISNPESGVTATNDTANALYVVSTGYNANIAGDYGTMWKIYNGSGQLISNAGGRVGVPPSVLLLRGSSSGYSSAVKDLNYPSANRSVDGVGSYTDSIDDYEAIYKALHNSSYTGKRVYITYEKDAQDTRKVTSGTGANRLDGRWYYTHLSDSVQSKIGIEYWDNAQNKWVTDTIPSDSITGSYTGCSAKFTDNNTTTSKSYTIENNENYSFTASTVSGWKFDSWQIKYSDTSYDPIATTASATMPATLSYNIVARFVPTTAGDLTINHTLNKASSGEGTVDMEVKVYSDSSKNTLVDGGSKTGSRVYLGDAFINNTSASNYVIEITLKTTPKYDGKVSQFTYDKFNSDNGITATTIPADLENAAENALTTSTFTIPVSSLYNVSTLKTRELNYTSLIDETLHKYNFTYNLTTRGEESKTYTSKGVINKSEYEKIVSDQANHVLDNSVLVDKAPFESNFLKSNTLNKGPISYDSETHTYTASSTFMQSGAVPKYHVRFELPYSYLTSGDASATPPTKKYTVTNTKTYVANPETFDLVANYNTFITIDATDTKVGTQAKVDKVTDGSDVNHVGNDFITAPEELKVGNTTMFFQYWDIKKLKSDGSAGDDVAKIYYPDFHYRVYNNYYVKAVYSDKAEDSWKHHYSEEDNKDVNCSILYLGDSRNQWNTGDGESSSAQTVAADMIYNDFIFHYTYKGQELKNVDDKDVEVGMILERATYLDTSDSNKQKWLTGSTSVNDMSYYRATYGGDNTNSTESTRKLAIETALKNDTELPSGTIKQKWENNVLNNKNFTEQSYRVYSQFGQTVANDTITFAKDNVIDNYVYRAYAYVKDAAGYTLSDPVYFCMRYTSNLKYTE